MISAINSILLEDMTRRDIAVKDAIPAELAYSDNGGKDWIFVRIFEDEKIMNTQCFHYSHATKTLFLATTKGRIYRSEDYGETWELVENQVLFTSPFCFLSESSLGRVYAGNALGLAYSDDNGGTWSKMPTPEGWFVE